MVHGSWALGWFNPLFFEPVGTSPHPAIWLRKVGLLSSQSEPWVDATCSLETEHPGCAENQAIVNHRCSAEHVLLHALVKYMIQLALQHTFVYTQYNHVFWALWNRFTSCLRISGASFSVLLSDSFPPLLLHLPFLFVSTVFLPAHSHAFFHTLCNQSCYSRPQCDYIYGGQSENRK